MDNTKQSPAVLSLCSGYGGIEIGLERALGKLDILTHVEIEAFAIANLVNKMETGWMVPAPIWTDVKTLNARMFRGYVDILTGGYPCQPFSCAGKRKGADDPRHLWPHIKRIIADCQPRWVFFENVEGHLSKGVAEVLADLEEMAYTPVAGVFSAAEVGAPHQRKRVFILAHSVNVRGHYRGAKYPPEQLTTHVLAWPAQPGEEQYDWEAPRVVDSKSAKRRRSFGSDHAGWRAAEIRRPDGTDGQNRQIESELGRAIDGFIHRVDRLRLLGNGVVPQTAEKAFITLYRKLIHDRT